MEIDLNAPENVGGAWLTRPKRETALHPPKDKPDESKPPEDVKKFNPNHDPGGEGGGQFTSGNTGPTGNPAREIGQGTDVTDAPKRDLPKWKKSKNPANEFGHVVTYAGRSYEIYHDPGSMGWHSLDLLNKNMPGAPGVPTDNIGYNKGEAMNAIMSGRLAQKIDLIKADEHALKTITDGGGKYNGIQYNSKSPDAKRWALITEKTSGSTGMIPLDEVTPESVAAKLAEIKGRTKKTEAEDIVRMATEATIAALAPTLEMLAKGQMAIVEGLNAETEQIPVRDEQKRITKVIRRRVKSIQPIPETKLPKGTGPTVTS